MILYFADRNMNILGQASTGLPKGLTVENDLKSLDVDTGTVTFECEIPYDDNSRDKVQSCTEAGNYLLRSNGEENEFYTIIDTEGDSEDQKVYIYAEDAGLDLLNEIVGAYEADEAYPISHYIEKFTYDSGFEIGINEVEDLTRKLSWEGEATASERVASVATQFDNAEISFSFDIKELIITNKYINIYKKRGQDTGVQLRLNREVDKIITKKSVANLCTALQCTGGTPEGKNDPITLQGYEYDDGDFYVSGSRLCSREALKKWSRYIWAKEPNQISGSEGHIVGTFSYDTTSQSELCNRAIGKLKLLRDTEVNYEVDINRLPENVRIGDRVNVINDAEELYLSARILKLAVSVCNKTSKATLGEYLIKDSGISEKVQELSQQFSELAKSRTFYTWVAYAEDENGNGISLNPDGKDYMGTAANQLSSEPDLSDPTIYTWVKTKGEPGDPGEPGEPGEKGDAAKSVTITASSQVFKSTDGGLNFLPDTITLTPVFQGEISYSKWQYSTDGGAIWTDVSDESDGLSVLNDVLTIDKASTLYTDAISSVSFKCVSSDSSYYDVMTILKLYDVSDIEIGGRNLILDGESVVHVRSDATQNWLSDVPIWRNSDYGISLLKNGGEFTISFDYEVTGITSNCNMLVCLKSTDGSYEDDHTSEIVCDSGNGDFYLWKKYGLLHNQVVEVEVSNPEIAYKSSLGTNQNWSYVEYADEITVSNGEISLVDPTTIADPSVSNLSVVIGKYIYSSHKKKYYRVPSTAKIGSGGSYAYTTRYVTEAFELSVGDSKGEFIGNVLSQDKDAFPENGIQDEYWYEYFATVKSIPLSVGDNSGHYECVFTPNEGMMQYGTGWIISNIGEGNNEGAVFTFINTKLEKGNKATDYTSAPEDIDIDIEEARKVATNYMDFIPNIGLVVGNMTQETLGENILISAQSVDIRNGDTILASYSADKIELGKESNDSIIEMCGGIGKIATSGIDSEDPEMPIEYKRSMVIDSGAIENHAQVLNFVSSTEYLPRAYYKVTVNRQTEEYVKTSIELPIILYERGNALEGVTTTEGEQVYQTTNSSGTTVYYCIEGSAEPYDQSCYSSIQAYSSVYDDGDGSSLHTTILDLENHCVEEDFKNSIWMKASEESGATLVIRSEGYNYSTNIEIFHPSQNYVIDPEDPLAPYEGITITTPDCMRVKSSKSGRCVAFGVGSGALNRGIYDVTSGKWQIYSGETDLFLGPPSYSAYKPYYSAGDSFNLRIHTAGFCSSSSKNVYFAIPLGRPIIGSPTVTATSVDGLTIRSIGGYSHGSSASEYVKPTSYSVSYNSHYILIAATLSDTTNATNNTPVGITWSGTLKFT